MTNKEIFFPYYSGNIHFTKCIGHVSLDRFIWAHKNPSLNNMIIFESIKAAISPEVKRKLKQQLYSFTPSVKIEVGVARKYDNVIGFTGLMQLDFDKIETIDKAHTLKEYLFITYQCVICSYISPSGNGVKALIAIPEARDKEHFRAIYKSIEKEFEQIGYFDKATKNALLPLFLSYDNAIYSRDYSECFPWDKEDWTIEEQINVTSTPPNFNLSNYKGKQAKYFFDKAIRIFRTAIEKINDNGHTQLRSACLILGSRAAAGYLDISEAKELAIYCVETNSYLSKGTKGYIETAMWCIYEGYKNPIYYK